jgi:hypothetical protein
MEPTIAREGNGMGYTLGGILTQDVFFDIRDVDTPGHSTWDET